MVPRASLATDSGLGQERKSLRQLAPVIVLTLLLTIMLTLAIDVHQSSDPEPWENIHEALGGYPIVDMVLHDENLYAAANTRIYAYDGTSWAIINGPSSITSLESYAGELIIGAQGGLYWLDDMTTSLILTVPSYIKVLGVYNNTLYAGTYLSQPPTLHYCRGPPANASNWHVDTGFSDVLAFSGAFGSIDSLAEYNGSLYVASGGTVYCGNDAGWSPATTYRDVYAFLDMCTYENTLYLATRDLGSRNPAYDGGTGFSGRVIAYDGEAWTTSLDHDYWVFALETYAGLLYAGTANRILTYNGTAWATSYSAMNPPLYAVSLATHDCAIYVGMGNGSIFRHTAVVAAELSPATAPSSAYRWLDAADQAYGIDYQASYNYSQASVTVTYWGTGDTFTGTLAATNLKPNFAYQLKLAGTPGTTSNEQIGLAGRWWQEEWTGSTWANGQNLNNKGDGSSPNPNDVTYFARRDIEDPSSPTGYHYRYTGYLVFAYFLTDQNGDATVAFETGSCYHVLWKTSQRTPTANDGPVQTAEFDPDPSQPAYDVDYPASTVSIFGEWERLPMGDVPLAPGQYTGQLTLTEESFHGTAPLAGTWAAAMNTEISFTVTG